MKYTISAEEWNEWDAKESARTSFIGPPDDRIETREDWLKRINSPEYLAKERQRDAADIFWGNFNNLLSWAIFIYVFARLLP